MASRRHDDRQRVFIGDVQGCATELERLLEKIGHDPDRHAVYFAGDLVNRGPRSLDALRLAREIAADSVLGNHDLHLIARAAGARPAKPNDTLDDVLSAPDRDELLTWLRARPALITWDDVVLVHAAVHPGWSDLDAVADGIAASIDWSRDPLQQADLAFVTTVRYCDAAGNVPPPEIAAPALAATANGQPGPIEPPYAAWDSFWRDSRTVVFGHWAQRGLVVADRVRGLDTGCVWGGGLTAWLADEDRLVTVPAERVYQEVE